jgi:6-phosphogluconolactonase (cycloisomerase 2 family)
MKKLLFASLLSVLLFSCKKDDLPDFDLGKNYTGFIYTSTNATSGNAIIALGRHKDGTVEELKGSPYATGDRGDAAEGDFDTQWALRIVGDYLLAVNAGGNPVRSSVSIFKINQANGKLTQVDQNPSTPDMDNMNSRGVRAASIAVKTIGATTWVVVGNQFANPNYQGSPAVAHGTVMSTSERNLAVFTLNQTSGVLSYKGIGATYMDGASGGPTTVDFNAAGTKIAVSTWGVPHFATPNADLALQKPGRLYIYDFNAGMLTQTGMYEEEGVSGNIGFSWSPNDQYIYLSNFNLHSSKENNSLTVHNAMTGDKVQNFATGGRNDEGCWTWVSIDKRKLYVASFGENVISAFTILGNNLIEKTLDPNFFMRRGQIPPGDTKDMHETADGYLYVSGAFQSHTIATFRTSATGMLSEVMASPYYVPTSKGKSKEQHAYLGLTGLDKNDSYNKDGN